MVPMTIERRRNGRAGHEPRSDDAARAGEPDERLELSVFIADRDEEFLENCRRIVTLEGHHCRVESDPSRVRDLLESETFDLALLDEELPGVDPLDLLRWLREHRPDGLTVLMTETAVFEGSARAMGAGAWDYIAKPFGAGTLLAVMGRAAYATRWSRPMRSIPENEGVILENGLTILGASHALRAAVEKALRVAATDAPVLLVGESGTGKELFARLIHEKSHRARRSFVPVNCAALPGELLESEMFGHRRGAFTGAVREKRGLLETADEGTIFLDEVAEMPSELQAKLLRVLQDGVVRRVGSEEVDVRVDVRIVSATNREPRMAVEAGRLREDLFYRLQAVPIELPPLRERPEDIPILARHYARVLWQRYRGSEGPPPTFDREAMERLLSHVWRGNVRELKNVVGHGVIFTEPGRELGADDLPLGRNGNGVGEHDTSHGFHWKGAIDLQRPYHEVKEEVLSRFERQYVTQTLTRTEGNLSKAARLAGVNRATIYRLIERHDVAKQIVAGDVASVSGLPASSPNGQMNDTAPPDRRDRRSSS